jgi:cell division protein FtsI (penicillin-binding protein 3)
MKRQRTRRGDERTSSYDEDSNRRRVARRSRADTRDGNAAKLVVVLGILLGIVVLRLFWLQIVDGSELKAAADASHTNVITVQGKRGTIYDRNGNVLAMSVDCKIVYANPSEIEDPQAVAAILADNLGGTAQDYLSELTQDTTFVYINKQVDEDVADQIKSDMAEKDLVGVYMLANTKRVYPYGAVAGQVLGIVGDDGQGRTGLELEYNDILAGTDGQIVMETGLTGTPIAGGAYTETPATNGTDIVISLDINIQEMAEEKIVEGQEEYDAESGFVTVCDPKTGEILAMCSTPLMDPTDLTTVTVEQMTLHNVTDSYEPGSVMKILTMAIGIENGIINSNTEFTVPAEVKVGDDWVSDDDDRDYTMVMTPREIMRRSSNTGAILVERAIGADLFAAGMEQFGIGSTTGIDYPGEVSGLVTKLEDYGSTTADTMSFGQGMAIPQIQTVRAVAAVANQGILTTPHFLVYKGTEKVEWPEGGRACSAETAEEVIDLMRTVVAEGTAEKAAVEGYDIAAKTGTGEQASEEGGYKEYSYLSSLVGFAPASDADVLVYVAFNGTSYLASDSAAPVFSAIMGEALLDMGVKPSS